MVNSVNNTGKTGAPSSQATTPIKKAAAKEALGPVTRFDGGFKSTWNIEKGKWIVEGWYSVPRDKRQMVVIVTGGQNIVFTNDALSDRIGFKFEADGNQEWRISTGVPGALTLRGTFKTSPPKPRPSPFKIYNMKLTWMPQYKKYWLTGDYYPEKGSKYSELRLKFGNRTDYFWRGYPIRVLAAIPAGTKVNVFRSDTDGFEMQLITTITTPPAPGAAKPPVKKPPVKKPPAKPPVKKPPAKPPVKKPPVKKPPAKPPVKKPTPPKKPAPPKKPTPARNVGAPSRMMPPPTYSRDKAGNIIVSGKFYARGLYIYNRTANLWYYILDGAGDDNDKKVDGVISYSIAVKPGDVLEFYPDTISPSNGYQSAPGKKAGTVYTDKKSKPKKDNGSIYIPWDAIVAGGAGAAIIVYSRRKGRLRLRDALRDAIGMDKLDALLALGGTLGAALKTIDLGQKSGSQSNPAGSPSKEAGPGRKSGEPRSLLHLLSDKAFYQSIGDIVAKRSNANIQSVKDTEKMNKIAQLFQVMMKSAGLQALVAGSAALVGILAKLGGGKLLNDGRPANIALNWTENSNWNAFNGEAKVNTSIKAFMAGYSPPNTTITENMINVVVVQRNPAGSGVISLTLSFAFEGPINASSNWNTGSKGSLLFAFTGKLTTQKRNPNPQYVYNKYIGKHDPNDKYNKKRVTPVLYAGMQFVIRVNLSRPGKMITVNAQAAFLAGFKMNDAKLSTRNPAVLAAQMSFATFYIGWAWASPAATVWRGPDHPRNLALDTKGFDSWGKLASVTLSQGDKKQTVKNGANDRSKGEYQLDYGTNASGVTIKYKGSRIKNPNQVVYTFGNGKNITITFDDLAKSNPKVLSIKADGYSDDWVKKHLSVSLNGDNPKQVLLKYTAPNVKAPPPPKSPIDGIPIYRGPFPPRDPLVPRPVYPKPSRTNGNRRTLAVYVKGGKNIPFGGLREVTLINTWKKRRHNVVNGKVDKSQKGANTDYDSYNRKGDPRSVWMMYNGGPNGVKNPNEVILHFKNGYVVHIQFDGLWTKNPKIRGIYVNMGRGKMMPADQVKKLLTASYNHKTKQVALFYKGK